VLVKGLLLLSVKEGCCHRKKGRKKSRKEGLVAVAVVVSGFSSLPLCSVGEGRPKIERKMAWLKEKVERKKGGKMHLDLFQPRLSVKNTCGPFRTLKTVLHTL
jgi:hypothetical protein